MGQLVVAKMLQYSSMLMSDEVNIHDAPRLATTEVMATRRASGVGIKQ
jgi:hypothetical protein